MDELDDHPKNYRYLTYKEWCELLSTIKVKDERKIASVHIKKIDSARSASLSDSKESARIPRIQKDKTVASRSHKTPRRAHDRHHGTQRYCVIFKKSGIPECKYASHSTKDCTGVHTKGSIKDGIVGPIGSRTHYVQQNKKSEKS